MQIRRVGNVSLYDYEPSWDFAADVVFGLRESPRRIPSKYLYDQHGSELFEQICGLPEYYLTRTELSIMRTHISEIAALPGPRCAIVEPGSGSGLKTRMLLEALDDAVAYIPVDISRELLLQTAASLASDYPGLEVAPVCADYLSDWELPPLHRAAQRNVVFFPGSTIGNMEPHEAVVFLRRMGQVCGADGALLIGVDLRKDAALIASAYNDTAGITREFNLNLVERLRRELNLDIPPDALAHSTQYNEAAGRNESYLVAMQSLQLAVSGESFNIGAGERILIEHSYKYSIDGFAALAAGAGLAVRQVWTDSEQLFSVQYLVDD
ncbi:MAG: L-histidine N(alpha)-methyltransferase [bacterium]|nr:L-histidine N(alpha)-methyltransferase [bacterium]